MKKIILASSSPRRKDLLKQIGLDFEIDKSNYEEDMTLKMEPSELAKHLSLGKAKDVAQRHKNAIIISGDTFCAIDGEVLGKPHTAEKAKEMLQKKLSQPLQKILMKILIREQFLLLLML